MEKIRLAIQKSGRLSEESLSLIRQCGIDFQGNLMGKLKASATNFPVEFLFLRDDDIPGYVEDGVADLGIVGENVVMEIGKKVALVKKLGFSKCRLSIAIPRAENYSSNYLEGKSIATSYPVILTEFLQKKKIHAEIHTISGSVEIAPSIGLAEAICDIVSSGSTLLNNGLKEVETVFESEAVLVANKSLSDNKQILLESLLFRIKAHQTVKKNKYILLNIPNNKIESIANLLPGMKSPTIVPLAKSGWSSLHSVISEDDFWSCVEAIKEAGAEGILLIPIEKMVI